MDFGDGGDGVVLEALCPASLPPCPSWAHQAEAFPCKAYEGVIRITKMHIKIEKIYEPLLKHCLGGWFGAA